MIEVSAPTFIAAIVATFFGATIVFYLLSCVYKEVIAEALFKRAEQKINPACNYLESTIYSYLVEFERKNRKWMDAGLDDRQVALEKKLDEYFKGYEEVLGVKLNDYFKGHEAIIKITVDKSVGLYMDKNADLIGRAIHNADRDMASYLDEAVVRRLMSIQRTTDGLGERINELVQCPVDQKIAKATDAQQSVAVEKALKAIGEKIDRVRERLHIIEERIEEINETLADDDDDDDDDDDMLDETHLGEKPVMTPELEAIYHRKAEEMAKDLMERWDTFLSGDPQTDVMNHFWEARRNEQGPTAVKSYKTAKTKAFAKEYSAQRTEESPKEAPPQTEKDTITASLQEQNERADALEPGYYVSTTTVFETGECIYEVGNNGVLVHNPQMPSTRRLENKRMLSVDSLARISPADFQAKMRQYTWFRPVSTYIHGAEIVLIRRSSEKPSSLLVWLGGKHTPIQVDSLADWGWNATLSQSKLIERAEAIYVFQQWQKSLKGGASNE